MECQESKDEHVETIIFYFSLSFFLNVCYAGRRLMWPIVHGRGRRIPIHLSFASHELVNKPEHVSKDIHRATKSPAISLVHNEYLPCFTAFNLTLAFVQ